MRRIISILLIIAVLLEIAGFYCIYVAKQIYIKESAQELMHHKDGLDRKLRLAFKLKNNLPEEASFRWIDKNEFTYNRMMFDVSDKEIKGDSIILYCFNDSDELSLIEQFKKLFIGKPENKSPENNSTLLQFITDLFIPVEKNELTFIPEKSLIHVNYNSDDIKTMSYDILKPPPQFS